MGSWRDFWASDLGWISPAYKIGKEMTRNTAKTTYSPTDEINAYDKAKESASQLNAGRTALGERATQSRLRSQGISNIPGVQSAVSLPGRYQDREQLNRTNAALDIEKNKAIEQRRKLQFAIRQYENEKDDARKQR